MQNNPDQRCMFSTEIFRGQRYFGNKTSPQGSHPLTQQMPQPAERELLKCYRTALRTYIEANASLEGLTGHEFTEAYRRAEEARAEFEKARKEMLVFRAKAGGA